MSEPPSRLPLVLFGLLLALCAALAIAVAVEPAAPGAGPSASGGGPGGAPAAGGQPAAGGVHPRFPSMDHGGSGRRRHGPILGLAWAFGALQIALVAGCLALGARRRRVRAGLAAAGLVLGAIVTMMVVSYRGHLDEPGAAFLALPVPTAWFLYGFWPAQFLVVGLYVWLFDREIVTPHDMARFREILARRTAAGGSPGRAAGPPGVGAVRRRTPPAGRPSPLGLGGGPTGPARGAAPPPAGSPRRAAGPPGVGAVRRRTPPAGRSSPLGLGGGPTSPARGSAPPPAG